MENELTKRDHIGVQDFVLLEDYEHPEAFVENLKKRFTENLIYTYIGPVLVSVNPYHQLDIYNDEIIQTYRNVNFYELPPHIYAIADAAFRTMRSETRDVCVLISGESGAGKTEASKKILHYIAASSVHSKDLERVKERLLQSTPLLEAFGNAKTNRNDNSSRFGKYMDIQFDFKGGPVGGHILNYLLEKSRVVHHSEGERNFHIFYQLVQGATPMLLSKLKIQKDPELYHYLKQGNSTKVDSLNDHKDFHAMKEAMEVCDFSKQDQDAVFSIVGSVLHLGNVKFEDKKDGEAFICDKAPVEIISQLLGCPEEILVSALQNKTIEAMGEKMKSSLTKEQALYARDALAKGVYDRLFTWIVQKINESLSSRRRSKCNLMGLLDIYGFEIVGVNSFEQFCINFCNEKLQQLFIELTLKSEQEEYQREGIEWEPVHYFNNKIICDLVEGKPIGIITLLDEECLRPGDTTDITFLDKLSETIGTHPHFLCHARADNSTRKTIARDEFRLIHYAGEVTYNAKGFLDKNNDLLFRDLKEAMSETTNPILSKCFPKSELYNKKRPDTAGTQFKNSLSQLMVILMSKEPSYVRCIKPNDFKMRGVFDERIVNHQVKYLGLMENLRVRRAGFAYRRPYEVFLKRYKCLCPETWPHYRGAPKDGVEILVRHLDYDPEEFRLGKTKLFIRFPRVLFATEDAFQHRKHDLATAVQAQYRGFAQKKKYKTLKFSTIILQSYWRRYKAKKLMEKRKHAAQVIRKFINGYIHRKEEECDENREFIRFTKHNYLYKIQQNLPKTVLDKSWPSAPSMLQEASSLLRKLCMKNLILKYMKKVTPDFKSKMDEKVEAESLFKGKKSLYGDSVKHMFVDSRLDEHHERLISSVFDSKVKSMEEKVKYSSVVTKFDRHGYKPRKRLMILTDQHLYLVTDKDCSLKDKIPYDQITGILSSCHGDGLFIVTVKPDENGVKGDLILRSEEVIEVITKLAMIGKKSDVVQVISDHSISHGLSGGKAGTIDFVKGPVDSMKKGKNGHFCVIVAH
ncbi:unconventional myosin-Ic-like [Mytilus edulis]|uniref:unconventional myosin-Ic-like n=1 Tax=Mytilus edulis TaxID=6550 RepID=UPI0039EFC8D6